MHWRHRVGQAFDQARHRLIISNGRVVPAAPTQPVNVPRAVERLPANNQLAAQASRAAHVVGSLAAQGRRVLTGR